MISDRRTRTVLEVLTGARTVREVAAETGCGVGTAHRDLCAMRDEGLVTWEDRNTQHKTGTLRPSVYVVANP